MGMSFFIFISLKQLLYNIRTSLFCKGRADFFSKFKCAFDFTADSSIAKMPTIHIPNSISPIIDGVLLLTDSVKSLICFAAPDAFIFTVVSVMVFIFGAVVCFNFSSHRRICENQNRRKGRNGTASRPSSGNHKLNCIRLVRQLFNTRFAMRNITMTMQIRILQREKRIPKSAILIPPVCSFGEKRAQGVYF